MRKTFHVVIFAILLGWLPVTGDAQLTPSYDWKVMETEHFRVIFHPGVEGLAAEAAIAAEDAYQRWAAELNTTPPAMTDIVVIDFDDSPNGFADSFNLTSWEFVSQIQFGVIFGGRVPSNMGDVVYHEYWHIADINHTSGFSSMLRNVFGRYSLPNRIKPWFNIEGSATYSEDLVYGYSRASAALSGMYMRQFALDNDFPSFEKAANRYSNMGWPSSGTLAYVMGAWFMRYIEETYGRGMMAKFNEINANNWLSTLSLILGELSAQHLGIDVYVGPNFNDIMSEATGASAEELYVGFQQWLRAQALDQLARVEADGGPTVGLKLTDYGYWTNQPKWSPDGNWIVYEHNDTFRHTGIRMIRPDGTDDHALSNSVIIFDNGLNWSPDSQQLVYSSYDQFGPYDNVNDLYLYDIATRRNKRITWGLRAFNPVFTPDGEHILFAENVGGDRSPRISRLNVEMGNVEVVQAFPDGTFVDFFALSPDGQQLALSIWKWPGYTDLYLMPADGGDLTPLMQDMNEDFRPVWSPDGEYILFDSIRDETFNLHAVRVSDGQAFRITNVVTGAFSPTVSPDGSHIAFVSYSGAGYDLHRMDYDPASWTQVSFGQEDIPDWEGFPTVDYEVKPYDPYVTMTPKYWYPLISDTSFSVNTATWDALYRQYYAIEAGYDWEQASPFGTLVYINEEHLSPVGVTAVAGLSPFGDFEVLSFEYSPIEQFFLEHSLFVDFQRANFGGEFYSVSGGWSYYTRIGKGQYWNDFTLSVSDELNYDVEGDAWDKNVVLGFRSNAHLPVIDIKGEHRFATKLTLGWSDLEGNFGLGGTRGRFMVRGQPRGALRGSHVAAASAEYRYPVLSIEKGWGLHPIFLDDVRVSAFVDAGTAAESFDLVALQENLIVGYGAEVQISFTTGFYSQRAVTFGFAYGLGQSEPELYMSFGSSF